MPPWRRYLRFWRADVDADVDAELTFHYEMRVRELVARGMTEAEATAAASPSPESVRRARVECSTIGHRRQRRVARAQTIDSLVQDTRYALRTLRRQLGWSAIAVLTLALGIGATTAMFSVVNSLVLHPIAYPNADRVVMIWSVRANSPDFMIPPPAKAFAEWRSQAHTLESIEEFEFVNATLTGRGDAAALHGATMSPGFLAFAGTRPLLGRGFVASDSLPGSPRVAMIGEPMWRARFGASDSVLGKTLVLDDRTYQIVGVAPGSLRLPFQSALAPDFWLPLGRDTLAYGHLTVGRLRSGVDATAATRELDTIAARLSPGPRPFVTRVAAPPQMISSRSTLGLLAAASGLLLIVACTNVAHLLVARGATRRRELAIRAALGAERRRLLRQLLTESFVLAAIGSALGLVIGCAGVRAVVGLRPKSFDQLSLAHVDTRVVGVALLVSIVTGVAFGLTAALHSVRRTTSDALRGNVLSGTTTRPSNRLRSGLVVTEMALSTLLLVGAALVVRSVVNLERTDPAFDAANLYSLALQLPDNRYPSPADRAVFLDALAKRARSVTGVSAVTIASAFPPEVGGYMLATLEIEGGDTTRSPQQVAQNTVDDDYFGVLGLRLIDGASFTPGSAARGEVVINEGLARRLWPSGRAVGRRVRFGGPRGSSNWLTIVGVASNVPMHGLSNDRSEPLMYLPFRGSETRSGAAVAVRTQPGADPGVALRAIVRTLDPRLPPPAVRSVARALDETIASQRFAMTLLGMFAALALILSAVGLYGVISFVVTQRAREIGIRVALGATSAQIARAVVARGFALSAAGVLIGLVAAVWAAKLIANVLYGVEPVELISYGVTSALLLGISLVACVVPMRRAAAIDPAITMRAE